MQEDYDQAEVAWQRALEIDPAYTIAKQNLVALSNTRNTGIPSQMEMNEPFRNGKLKQGITFLLEE